MQASRPPQTNQASPSLTQSADASQPGARMGGGRCRSVSFAWKRIPDFSTCCPGVNVNARRIPQLTEFLDDYRETSDLAKMWNVKLNLVRSLTDHVVRLQLQTGDDYSLELVWSLWIWDNSEKLQVFKPKRDFVQEKSIF